MLPSRNLWLERPPVSLKTYESPDTHTQWKDGPVYPITDGMGDKKHTNLPIIIYK